MKCILYDIILLITSQHVIPEQMKLLYPHKHQLFIWSIFKQSINSNLMKKLLLILLLSFLFIYPSQSKDFSIVGTWKQVSFRIIKNGTTVSKVTNTGNGKQLKSWSKESFIFVGKAIDRNNVSYSFGNGNYSLDGNHYTEKIKVHVSPSYEGKNLQMYMELKGDTLIQIFPVGTDWSYDMNNCWIEKFIKVD